MKRIAAVILCLVTLFGLLCAGGCAEGASGGKGKVVILATGGTIAGIGEEGKTTGYISGGLTVEDLLFAIPQLADIAEIESPGTFEGRNIFDCREVDA